MPPTKLFERILDSFSEITSVVIAIGYKAASSEVIIFN